MNNIIISGILTIAALAVLPQLASAQYTNDQPSTRTFLLDKKVLDPRTNKFVDNLSIDQFKFLPNQDVWYRVEFKNIKDYELTNIIGKDVLPQSMQLVSGDGVYNLANNTLTVTIDKIAPHSSRFWDIKARFVTGKGGTPVNSGCVNNYAEGSKDGEMMADYASVCMSTKIMGEVSELPKTGPASTLLLIGSLIAGVVGVRQIFFKKTV